LKRDQGAWEDSFEYAKTVLPANIAKSLGNAGADTISSLRSASLARLHSSWESADANFKKAAERAQRSADLLAQGQRLQSDAHEQLVEAHSELTTVAFELKRSVEELQEPVDTLPDPEQAADASMPKIARAHALQVQSDTERYGKRVKSLDDALDLDAEAGHNKKLIPALDGLLAKSKGLLESLEEAIVMNTGHAPAAPAVPEEMRMAEVRVSTQANDRAKAGMAAMARAAMASAMAHGQDGVADARARLDAAGSALDSAQARADSEAVAAAQQLRADSLKDLSRAQLALDTQSGLRVTTVQGKFSMPEAAAQCELRRSELCTHTQLVQAYLQGHHSCRCGWTSTSLDGGSSYVAEYATQMAGSPCPASKEWGIIMCGHFSPLDKDVTGHLMDAHCCTTMLSLPQKGTVFALL